MAEQSGGTMQVNLTQRSDDGDVDMESVSADAKRTRSLSNSDSENNAKRRTKTSNQEAVEDVLSQISPEMQQALPSTATIHSILQEGTTNTNGQDSQLEITQDMLALPSTSEIYNTINLEHQHKDLANQNRQVSSNAHLGNTTFINKTVSSEDQGCVIIIKENNSSGTNSLFSRPKEFAVNINKTAFHKLKIKDIRVNRQANLAG